MNIFILDRDPIKCASLHNDTHVSKMLLEACQMLCTAHHIHNPNKYDIPYKIAHQNHPCSIWCRSSRENYIWLLRLASALFSEHLKRKGKIHACSSVLLWLDDNIDKITWGKNIALTPFVLAMPDQYKTDCPVQSYMNYHRAEKRGFWRRIKNTGLSVWCPYYWSNGRPQFMRNLNFTISQQNKIA